LNRNHPVFILIASKADWRADPEAEDVSFSLDGAANFFINLKKAILEALLGQGHFLHIFKFSIFLVIGIDFELLDEHFIGPLLSCENSCQQLLWHGIAFFSPVHQFHGDVTADRICFISFSVYQETFLLGSGDVLHV